MKPQQACLNNTDIVIIAAKRTPMGNLLGQLSTLSAPQLAAIAHRAAIEQAGIRASDIDEILTGCVLQAGIGQAPARQAAILADIPHATSATTINKMCGSGMKAIMLAHDVLRAQSADMILAGGMESMSQAPYLLMNARQGYRMGHQVIRDHLYLDGLEDAYNKEQLMGVFADETARELNLSREAQDEYAARSMTRALAAQEADAFDDEIAPVTLRDQRLSRDEGPDPAKLGKIHRLKPAFVQQGTVTAGNSSSIADGAASLLITTAAYAKQLGAQPLARIVAHSTYADAPAKFTTAPIGAIQALLTKTAWKAHDVDLYEINEAFAVVTMATINALKLDIDRVNVHGGACALGHPLGASGARIVVTLLYALQRQQKTRGIAALCIGGGEATALAIERL